jgi:transposase
MLGAIGLDGFRGFMNIEAEYNPIEKLWSKLKNHVRRITNDLREEFDDAVAKAMSTISTDNIVAWFKHCGYAVNKT